MKGKTKEQHQHEIAKKKALVVALMLGHGERLNAAKNAKPSKPEEIEKKQQQDKRKGAMSNG